MKQLPQSFKDKIPNDHSRQVKSEYYIKSILDGNGKTIQVLDLGCGSGRSVEMFKKTGSILKWTGLDIVKSPEIDTYVDESAEFHLFDGINIPFDSNRFDLIFCNQVYEHVRYPERLLKETFRVLRPGGYFVGSTSQLEPYHSLSFWNYTPYGFSILLEEAGFQIDEIRPSIDAFSLITRRGLGRSGLFGIFWKIESPLNLLISLVGLALRKPPSWVNLIKLIFCGQFCFMARKPE